MMRASALFLTALSVVTCTTAGPASPGQPQGGPEPPAAPQKPLILALRNEVISLEPSMNGGGNNADFDALSNAYLAYLTPEQQPIPISPRSCHPWRKARGSCCPTVAWRPPTA